MPYVYLILSTFFMAAFNIVGGFYERKTSNYSGAVFIYNLIQTSTALLFWIIIYAADFSFEKGVLLYSLGFGISYALCLIGSINAIKHGSVALTSLIVNMSLISATIWGLIFWNSEFTFTVAIGLILVSIALALCLLSGKADAKQKKSVSLKWCFFAFMAFIGNAGCTIIQREQQIAYSGKHGNMLMVFAIIISVLVCLSLYLKNNKSNTKIILKKAWYYPIAAGAVNSLLNLFVILLASTSLSPSLIYPVIAAGGLMITMMFSLFAFKEKLMWRQWLGFAVGTIAVVLLNI